MNLLVDFLKSVTECFLHVADTMELGVVRSHDSTVIADQLLIVVAIVPQRFIMEHAKFQFGHVRVGQGLSSDHSLTKLSRSHGLESAHWTT